MFKFLIDGGAIIMFPLTGLLLFNIFLIVRFTLKVFQKDATETWDTSQIDYIKYLAVLSLTIGLFGQIMGLYGAFEAIEQIGSVSQKIFFSGVRVSSITTLYGFSIFIFTYSAWILLRFKLRSKEA